MQTDTTREPAPGRATSPFTRRFRRPVLRPGVHVLRRSAGELQLGLDPGRALVLPDRPRVRALLAALTSPASVVDDEVYDDRTLALLADAGLLVDADALLPLMPTGPDAGAAVVSRPEVAAMALDAGDRAAERLKARATAEIEVLTTGSPCGRSVAAELAGLLTASGVRCVEADERTVAAGSDRASPQGQRVPHGADPTAAVVVAVGEPGRERVDDLVRAGRPHLLLRLVEGRAVVGPFVLPGETACLRCLDAHHTDVDPAWPLLVTQYARAVSRDREDTVPEPVDPLLARLACAWAARELVSFAEGRRPATLSTTVRLDPHLTALETQHWPLHPACGCAWA